MDMLKKLVGIDFGKTRIGFASGQMITKTAAPIGTVIAVDGEPNWIEVDKIIKQWRPTDIIIGLPIDAHNQETDSTQAARDFATKVAERYSQPIHLVNEAFSTREARWRLEEVKKKSNRHLKVDAMAACVILETWMNQF